VAAPDSSRDSSSLLSTLFISSYAASSSSPHRLIMYTVRCGQRTPDEDVNFPRTYYIFILRECAARPGSKLTGSLLRRLLSPGFPRSAINVPPCAVNPRTLYHRLSVPIIYSRIEHILYWVAVFSCPQLDSAKTSVNAPAIPDWEGCIKCGVLPIELRPNIVNS